MSRGKYQPGRIKATIQPYISGSAANAVIAPLPQLNNFHKKPRNCTGVLAASQLHFQILSFAAFLLYAIFPEKIKGNFWIAACTAIDFPFGL
ncbi:MAG: hypothetical protein ACOX8E_04165 [Ruminococcus sp.]|jgi:hypothetical protein